MSVWTTIGTGLAALLPAVLKKKLFVLWYRSRDEKWREKSGPMSHRQCRKAKAQLLALGTYEADRFVILRKGVAP